jgi:hypothetical protein
MRSCLILITVLLLAVTPVTALAAGPDDGGGVILRVNGDYTLPAGEELDTLTTIRGHAIVEGVVHGHVLTISGSLVILGAVEGDVQVIDGTLTLRSGASVENIRLLRSDLVREPGAAVSGDITRSSGFFLRPVWVIVFGALVFLGIGFTVLITAFGFAVIGGSQLNAASAALIEKPGQTMLTGLVAFVALPVLATIALASVIGVWVGLGIFFVFIPILTMLGYVTAGTMIGNLILNRRARPDASRPVGEALLGTFLLLFVLAIPGVNVLALLGFALWGAGGIVYGWKRGLTGEAKPVTSEPPVAPTNTPAARV